MSAEIVAVVAMDEKRGIAKDGKIPWRIPEDVQRFIDETMYHPVIMGRRTFESIPTRYRPLVDRDNIVVTRQQDLVIPGCFVAHSVEEALEMAAEMDPQRICVIGGAEIYRAALSVTDVLYLTTVHDDFECKILFPEFRDQFPFQSNIRSSSYKDISYTFEDLSRRS